MAMRVNDLSGDIPLGCTSATRVCFIGDSFATRFGKYCSAHAIVNGGFDLDVISLSDGARRRSIEFCSRRSLGDIPVKCYQSYSPDRRQRFE